VAAAIAGASGSYVWLWSAVAAVMVIVVSAVAVLDNQLTFDVAVKSVVGWVISYSSQRY